MGRTPHLGLLHIKRDTAGTSNELSLSVLDAKKNQAGPSDGGRPSPKTVAGLGKVALFTVPGKEAKGTADAPASAVPAATMQGLLSLPAPALPYDPDAEVARRKHRRRTFRIVNSIAGIAVIAVLAFIGVSYANKHMAQQQSEAAALDGALSLIEQSDTTIVAMDQAVNSSVDDQALDDMQGILSDLPSASSDLDRAANKAAEVGNSSSDSKEKEAASRAEEAIAARKDLITQGTALMKDDIAAKHAANDLTDAWSSLLEGDVLAKEAAYIVSDTTDAKVRESMDNSSKALEQFTQAQSLVQGVSDSYPAADVSLLVSYIAKRVTSQQYALASDNAILVQDKATAESNNTAANAADAEAVAIAKRLPDNPARPVLDAYTAVRADPFAAYSAARTRASFADAYLRDYLGGSGK
jgi:hypothetical protein